MFRDPVFIASSIAVCILLSATLLLYPRPRAACPPLPTILDTTEPPPPSLPVEVPPPTTPPPSPPVAAPPVAVSELSDKIGSRMHARVCEAITSMSNRDFVQKFVDGVRERESMGFLGVYGCETVIFQPCADDSILMRVAECTAKEKGWDPETTDYYFEVLKLVRDHGCNEAKTSLDQANLRKLFDDTRAYFCR
jgi:hypothetical protein